MEVLGHSTIRLTMDTYGHVLPERMLPRRRGRVETGGLEPPTPALQPSLFLPACLDRRHRVPRHAQLMSPGVIPYGRLSCLVLTSC
jgi:hypothetical protein